MGNGEQSRRGEGDGFQILGTVVHCSEHSENNENVLLTQYVIDDPDDGTDHAYRLHVVGSEVWSQPSGSLTCHDRVDVVTVTIPEIFFSDGLGSLAPSLAIYGGEYGVQSHDGVRIPLLISADSRIFQAPDGGTCICATRWRCGSNSSGLIFPLTESSVALRALAIRIEYPSHGAAIGAVKLQV